jgi:hypothetical protein
MDYDMDAFRRDVAELIENGEEDDDMTAEKLAELLPEALPSWRRKKPTLGGGRRWNTAGKRATWSETARAISSP